MFDVEWPQNHPGLSEAVEQATQNNIQLAVSNPCFELWLILHFQDQGAWLDNNAARRARRSLDGSSDKGLDQRHQRNGTSFPNDNPSSGMHRLLASIEPP